MAKKRKPESAKIISVLIIVLVLVKVYIWPELDIEAVLSVLNVQQNEIVTQIDENNKDEITPPKPATTLTDDEMLNIHYIDVGQADAALITLGNETMLIDAGDEEHDDDVVQYLKDQGITNLTYAVGTHPHEDHIGGLDSVIRSIEIDTLLLPKAEHDSPSFNSLLDAMTDENLQAEAPKIGDTYKLGDANFTILNSVNSTPENLNNSSIVLRLVYGEQSYIFTGDAEKQVEYQMMDSGLPLKSNVLKVGHHGSTTSSLEKFILAVDPDIAIISVGADNSYGHPHEKIVNRLNRLKIKTYRTDLNGTIIISSDGKYNYVKVEKGE